MPTRKPKSKVEKSSKPSFLPAWDSFSTVVSNFINNMANRTAYNRAAYYHDLSFIINSLAETSYEWFTESKVNWQLIASELQAMGDALGNDIKYSVEMGKLDQDMYHYFNRFERLSRTMQYKLEVDHYDWYKSPTGQPLALNEIVKNLMEFTGELRQECTDDPDTLLRWADNLWCRQAYEDLKLFYNQLGKDPLFDRSDFGAGGPTPWSKP